VAGSGWIVVGGFVPDTRSRLAGLTRTSKWKEHIMSQDQREGIDSSGESGATRPVVSRPRGSASLEHPTRGEAFYEAESLIGAPAFYGPPVSFVLGPWLLLVLLLIGPFALIFTVLVVMAVAAVVMAVAAATIASPYLLIRYLHGHAGVHAKPRGPRRARSATRGWRFESSTAH
jgi:hypothetical protein